MFPVTFTVTTPEQLNAVMAALGFAPTVSQSVTAISETTAAQAEAKPAKAPKAKPAPLSAEQQAAVDDTAGLTPAGNAPGAAPAPTEPTASEPVAAAPAKIEYAELQAAVLALHKLDATAAKPIAEAMGFANFKSMPEDRWAEALEKVKAKTAEVKGGV